MQEIPSDAEQNEINDEVETDDQIGAGFFRLGGAIEREYGRLDAERSPLPYKSGFDRYSGTTPLTWDFSAWFSTSSSFVTLSSCSASHFSASRAAMQPEPTHYVSN